MGTLTWHTMIKTVVERLVGLPERDDIVNNTFWRCLLDKKTCHKICN
jgi:hypothetical protein